MPTKMSDSQEDKIISAAEGLGLIFKEDFKKHGRLKFKDGIKHIIRFENQSGGLWDFGKFVPERGDDQYFVVSPKGNTKLNETNFSDALNRFKRILG